MCGMAFWAFGFATLFWTLVLPWWSFPFDELGSLRQQLTLGPLEAGLGNDLRRVLYGISCRNYEQAAEAIQKTISGIFPA